MLAAAHSVLTRAGDGSSPSGPMRPNRLAIRTQRVEGRKSRVEKSAANAFFLLSTFSSLLSRFRGNTEAAIAVESVLVRAGGC